VSLRKGGVVEGTPFGRYRLIDLLGRGGMGEVWKAYDTATQRVFAVKVLPEQLASDPVFEQRFRREAYAAAGLNEPHVVPIHNFGEIDGRLYVDMRLVEGQDLEKTLANGPLDPARAVKIIEQVAAALSAAHRIGLVHRDVKPSNVLITEDDFAYLIDFGIARGASETGLTGTGNVIGTWPYMAPERFSTGQCDSRSDIYALTCVLYECLTCARPFPGDSVEQQIASHLTAPPPRPSVAQPGVSPQLDAVIAAGMNKDPEQRYGTTMELARAARSAITAPIPTPIPTPPPEPQHNQWPPVAPPTAASNTPEPQRNPVWSGGAPPTFTNPPPIYTNPPPNPGNQGWGHTQVRSNETELPRHPFQQPPQPPWQQPPGGGLPPPPKSNRNTIMIVAAAVAAVIALVVAVIVVTNKDDGGGGGKPSAGGETTTTTTTPPPQLAFSGTYNATFGPPTSLIGKPRDTPPLPGQTWGIKPACNSSGCVASGILASGKNFGIENVVFDDMDGTWVSVHEGNGSCKDVDTTVWVVMTLKPNPDGTLVGTYKEASTNNGCESTQPMTLTRTGDVNAPGIADPQNLPARQTSPAAGFQGKYHTKQVYPTTNDVFEKDGTVETQCLRDGTRCISYYLYSDGSTVYTFADSKWSFTNASDGKCNNGGDKHNEFSAEYPLPQPVSDPIAVLTGNGRQNYSGACNGSNNYTSTFTRTGD